MLTFCGFSSHAQVGCSSTSAPWRTHRFSHCDSLNTLLIDSIRPFRALAPLLNLASFQLQIRTRIHFAMSENTHGYSLVALNINLARVVYDPVHVR